MLRSPFLTLLGASAVTASASAQQVESTPPSSPTVTPVTAVDVSANASRQTDQATDEEAPQRPQLVQNDAEPVVVVPLPVTDDSVPLPNPAVVDVIDGVDVEPSPASGDPFFLGFVGRLAASGDHVTNAAQDGARAATIALLAERAGAEFRTIAAVARIALPPNRPTAREFLDPPAERLGDDLMAKADADHWALGGMDSADEILKWGNEGQVVISAVARPGDEPAFGSIAAAFLGRGERHVDDVPGGAAQPLAFKEAVEKVRVLTVLGRHSLGRVAALQDADMHGSPVSFRATIGLREGEGKARRLDRFQKREQKIGV